MVQRREVYREVYPGRCTQGEVLCGVHTYPSGISRLLLLLPPLSCSSRLPPALPGHNEAMTPLPRSRT